MYPADRPNRRTLKHNYRDLTCLADEPLDIEELETPRDRCSVVNEAVHYLAGSESAKYALTYPTMNSEETFFNCQEEDPNTPSENQLCSRRITNTSGYCDSGYDSDVDYVRNLCKSAMKTHQQSTADPDGLETPNTVSEHSIWQNDKVEPSQTPRLTPSNLGTLSKSGGIPPPSIDQLLISHSYHRDENGDGVQVSRIAGIGAKGPGSAEDVNTKLSIGGVSTTTHVSDVMSENDFPLSTNGSRINKSTDASNGVIGVNGDANVNNLMNSDCSKLLSFARQFKETYGAYPPSGAKVGSWESTAASTSHQVDNHISNDTFSGSNLPYGKHTPYGNGVDHKGSEQDGLLGNGVKGHSPELLRKNSGDASGKQLYGHTLSSDILLRKYTPTISNDILERPFYQQLFSSTAYKEASVTSLDVGSQKDAMNNNHYMWMPQGVKDRYEGDLIAGADNVKSTYKNEQRSFADYSEAYKSWELMKSMESHIGRQQEPAFGGLDNTTLMNKVELERNGSPAFHRVTQSANTVKVTDMSQQIDEFFKSRISPKRYYSSRSLSINSEPPVVSHPQEGSYHFNVPCSESVTVPVVIKADGACNAIGVEAPINKSHQSIDLITMAQHVEETPPLKKSEDICHVTPRRSTNVLYGVNETYAKSTLPTLPAKNDTWAFESLNISSDTGKPQLNISMVDGMLMENTDGLYNLGVINTEKSGDVNLYDSACVEFNELPAIEESPCQSSTYRAASQLSLPGTPKFPAMDTVRESTPAISNFADNVTTKTNYVFCDEHVELPSDTGLLSFDDDISSYVPGRNLDSLKSQLSSCDLFADNAGNPHIHPQTPHFNRFPSFGCGLTQPTASDMPTEFSDEAYTHLADNAPRNLSKSESQDVLLRKVSSLGISQQTYGYCDGRDEINTECPSCSRSMHVISEPVRISSCCSRQVIPYLSNTQTRKYSKGRTHSRRSVNDSSLCRSTSTSQTIQPKLLLPSAGMRRSTPTLDVSGARCKLSSDLFSDMSSDYVRVPSDGPTCTNCDCDKDCDFSDSEDVKERRQTKTKFKLEKSVLNPIEEMLEQQMQKGTNFESFVSLVKRLYEALDENKLMTSDGVTRSKEPMSDDLCVDGKIHNGSPGRYGNTSTTAGYTNGFSTTRTDNLDCQTKVSLSKLNCRSETPTTVPSLLTNRNSVVSPLERSPTDGSLPDKTKTSKWLKQALDDVKRSSAAARHGNVIGMDEQSERSDIPVPLTKEALISKMTSEPTSRSVSTHACRSSVEEMVSDIAKPAREVDKSTLELPDGLTQKHLLDVYDEVMKLAKIFHVKDVKSLTRAVTARINSRIM